MFNIGFPEFALIFTAALLLLGPKKLPEFARWIGQALRELRQATNEVRTAIDMELEREEFEKLQREFQDVVNSDLSFEDQVPDGDPPHDVLHEDMPEHVDQEELDDFQPDANVDFSYPPMSDDIAEQSEDASDAPASDSEVPSLTPAAGIVSHGAGFEEDEEFHTDADHPTPDDYPETPIPAQSDGDGQDAVDADNEPDAADSSDDSPQQT